MRSLIILHVCYIQGNQKILPLPEIYNRLKEIVHINLAYDTGPQVDTPLSSLKITVFFTMGRNFKYVHQVNRISNMIEIGTHSKSGEHGGVHFPDQHNWQKKVKVK